MNKCARKLPSLLMLFNNRCAWCHCDIRKPEKNEKIICPKGVGQMIRFKDATGKVVTIGMATVDHLIPKSKGGTDATYNLVPSCFGCNTRRNNGFAGVSRESLVINAILA